MTQRRIGIVMHGVTGRMGMNQHLVRSILEIRKQGGVALKDGVLVHAHAPGDAVHDDADSPLRHCILLIFSQSGIAALATPGQPSDSI